MPGESIPGAKGTTKNLLVTCREKVTNKGEKTRIKENRCYLSLGGQEKLDRESS